jgi:hypothetical protein
VAHSPIRSSCIGAKKKAGTPVVKLIGELETNFRQAAATASPLILDLDGDGVETIDKSAGIHFDHDGNQLDETTGWVGKDDGLLVWERNGNGQIDDGSELFGNQTRIANGSQAANGFAALSDLDSNHDGKIDAADAAFSHLRAPDSNRTGSRGYVTGGSAPVRMLGQPPTYREGRCRFECLRIPAGRSSVLTLPKTTHRGQECVACDRRSRSRHHIVCASPSYSCRISPTSGAQASLSRRCYADLQARA